MCSTAKDLNYFNKEGKAAGEGVLGRLPRSDRAGCDLVDCSQQRAGAGGPGIYDALHAGRRLDRCDAAGKRSDIVFRKLFFHRNAAGKRSRLLLALGEESSENTV